MVELAISVAAGVFLLIAGVVALAVFIAMFQRMMGFLADIFVRATRRRT